ncbi:hypothetical protein B9Z55_027317 [Caenorhabditis nigoni]|uniref:Secreted protein n=1 Tax=Caenorhabditis nigoni TaxID=1611254 RepID=A0A2G5SFZ7_9PELO|nr:hypothetical protein B9Z55_027317 [Caenorhabditis nigoni]
MCSRCKGGTPLGLCAMRVCVCASLALATDGATRGLSLEKSKLSSKTIAHHRDRNILQHITKYLLKFERVSSPENAFIPFRRRKTSITEL